MPRAWTAALCAALALVLPCAARAGTPYGVDDLLALENIGQVMIDPAERLVVIEHRRRYDSATDYAYGSFETRALSEVLFASVDHPEVVTPLFRQEPDAGYWLGGFSPSGKRLTVFRLSHRRLDLGVVDVASRTVQWLGVIPDLPIAHPAPSWIDDDRLVVVAFKARRLPFILSIGNAVQTDLPRLWQDMAAGAVPSATVADTVSVSPFAGERQVVRIDLSTGRSVVFASGAITDISVSRAGLLAIVSIATPAQPPVGTPIDPAFVSYRHAMDVIGPGATPTRTRISDDVLPAMMAWDDRGTKLAYVARMAGRDWTSARYQVADFDRGRTKIATLAPRPTIAGKQSSMVAHARWAGSRLLVATNAADGAEHWVAVDSNAPDRSSRNLGTGQMVHATATALWLRSGDAVSRIPIRGGRIATIQHIVSTGTSSLDPSSVGVRLLDNPVERATTIIRQRDHGRYVTTIDDHGVISAPTDLPPSAKLLAATARHAVSFAEDASGVGTLALTSAGGSPKTLLRTNIMLAARDRPRIVEIKSAASDGRTHSNLLFLPSNGVPNDRPPLVVMEYPGMVLDGGAPSFTSPSFFLPPNNVPILVGQGFAVLMPSLPPSTNKIDPLGTLAADVDRAVDAATATNLIDSKRIAVLGHSFGGFGALAIATRSTRYRGIVAVSGPYDLAAAHGSMAGPDRIRLEFGLPFGQDAGWAEGGQANMQVAPWTDPQRYIANSPSFALDHVQTPVLLLHGENDVVSMEQAERAFMGLARLGRDVTLVRYWGEGHVLASPANIRDYWSRVLTWLDMRFATASKTGDGAKHQAASQ